MANQNQPHSEAVRNLARSITERSTNDPAFLQQLQDNPWETLRAAGLDDSAIPDYLSEVGIQDEVSGYAMNEPHCYTTCITTIIPHGGGSDL